MTIYRSNQPLENQQVIGPYYDLSGGDEVTCHFCGNFGSVEDYKEIHDGHDSYACECCTVECPGCGDWIADEPFMSVGKETWHKECAKDAGIEDEEARQAAYDEYIERCIDERREERRRA